jgi:hypothetical protein
LPTVPILKNNYLSTISYREAAMPDIPALAGIHSKNGGSETFWNNRITGYINCTHHPQQALKPRIIYIAMEEQKIIDIPFCQRIMIVRIIQFRPVLKMFLCDV